MVFQAYLVVVGLECCEMSTFWPRSCFQTGMRFWPAVSTSRDEWRRLKQLQNLEYRKMLILFCLTFWDLQRSERNFQSEDLLRLILDESCHPGLL